MPPSQLRERTKVFAIDVVDLCRRLPKTEEGLIVRRQLLRAGTSVGANYRAVCRPRSDADFISKLGTVIEECDETAFWLELAIDIHLAVEKQVSKLLLEADELLRIFVASRETVRRRLRQRRPARAHT
jgi:four helix bundle protein